MKTEMHQKFDTEFTKLRDDVNIEMANIKDKMKSIYERLVALESCCSEDFPVPTTCVVMGLREEAGENIDDKCQQLLQKGMGLRFKPQRCMRLKTPTPKGLAW